jgi:hypothetical protein
MKAILTFVALGILLIIFSVCTCLYLKEHYNVSVFLTISWILAITLWVRSTGLLGKKRSEAEK